MDHQGFSVIECLSERVEFYPDVFNPADPREGGCFELIQEKKWDNTPKDELRHDRHRRARRPQTGATPVPRRLLPKRPTDQKRAREALD
jgi:2-oxoglutarate ferredoxin oxidoreductase subunit beta